MTDTQILRDRIETEMKKVVNLELALDLFSKDAHRFSTRGCHTCKTITELLGKPFGCLKLKEGKK